MLAHKFWGVVAVAGGAVQRFWPVLAQLMAAFAVKRQAIIARAVVVKAKISQQRVVYVVEGKYGDLRLAPLVFQVAALALRRSRQQPVQPNCFGALLGDVYVAALAAVIDNAVDRAVAVCALLLKFGVGIVTAKGGFAGMHGRQRSDVGVCI